MPLGASARHRTEHPRICPGDVHCLVAMVLLFSSVVGLASSYPTWAAVYQCRDAVGKSVLTNRPSQLRNCFVLSEETPSAPTPSEASTTPQESPPPSYAPPLPPNRQADIQGSSISSLPPPNPGASLSPSPPPPQPCSRGLNPFNPLSAPPCVKPEQSGAKPSGATPAPSQ